MWGLSEIIRIPIKEPEKTCCTHLEATSKSIAADGLWTREGLHVANPSWPEAEIECTRRAWASSILTWLRLQQPKHRSDNSARLLQYPFMHPIWNTKCKNTWKVHFVRQVGVQSTDALAMISTQCPGEPCKIWLGAWSRHVADEACPSQRHEFCLENARPISRCLYICRWSEAGVNKLNKASSLYVQTIANLSIIEGMSVFWCTYHEDIVKTWQLNTLRYLCLEPCIEQALWGSGLPIRLSEMQHKWWVPCPTPAVSKRHSIWQESLDAAMPMKRRNWPFYSGACSAPTQSTWTPWKRAVKTSVRTATFQAEQACALPKECHRLHACWSPRTGIFWAGISNRTCTPCAMDCAVCLSREECVTWRVLSRAQSI